jgi:hypothetical protein
MCRNIIVHSVIFVRQSSNLSTVTVIFFANPIRNTHSYFFVDQSTHPMQMNPVHFYVSEYNRALCNFCPTIIKVTDGYCIILHLPYFHYVTVFSLTYVFKFLLLR